MGCWPAVMARRPETRGLLAYFASAMRSVCRLHDAVDQAVMFLSLVRRTRCEPLGVYRSLIGDPCDST